MPFAQLCGLLTHGCTLLKVQYISALYDIEEMWGMHQQVRKLLGTLMRTLCPEKPSYRKPTSCYKAHSRHSKSWNEASSQGNAQLIIFSNMHPIAICMGLPLSVFCHLTCCCTVSYDGSGPTLGCSYSLTHEFVLTWSFAVHGCCPMQSHCNQRDLSAGGVRQLMACREARDHEKEASELVRSRRLAIVQLQEIIALAKSLRL